MTAWKVNVSAIIRDDKEGPFTWGEFDRLHADLLLAATKTQTESKVRVTFSNLHQDVWNLLRILAKLQWMHSLYSKGELDFGFYMMAASSDIDLFVVQLRAIFNEIAQALDDVADQRGAMPSRFVRLLNWLNSDTDRAKKVLGSFADDLIDLVNESAQCFHELRGIRDSMLYKGGQTVVFPDQNEILFQVHEGAKRIAWGGRRRPLSRT